MKKAFLLFALAYAIIAVVAIVQDEEFWALIAGVMACNALLSSVDRNREAV